MADGDSSSTTLAAIAIDESRAARRRVPAGSRELCATCQGEVRFSAKERKYQIIANVYVDGRWHHVEHYHDGCYLDASTPYGEPSYDGR